MKLGVLMRKTLILLVMVMVLVSTMAFAFDGPPEDFDKLNQNAEKRFHVRKQDNYVEYNRGRTKPYPGTPKEAAHKFLKEYHRMFKLSADLHEIKFEKEGGVRNMHADIFYKQYYRGIPVFLKGISVTMDTKNRIIGVIDHIEDIDNLSIDPVIQPDELEDVLSQNSPPYGPIVVEPKLVIYPFGSEPVLAYEVVAYETDTEKRMRLYVNTTTGEVIDVRKTKWDFSDSDNRRLM